VCAVAHVRSSSLSQKRFRRKPRLILSLKGCGKQAVAGALECTVTLITGGYGGMGRASARLFAREGATVFIASGNFSTGYSSSKWALEGLSRSPAYVYADWGVRSNVIRPGWIEHAVQHA